MFSDEIPENDVVFKTRYVDRKSSYQILRVDNDDVVNFHPYIKRNNYYLDRISNIIEEYNIKNVIILDYCKAFLNYLPIEEIIESLNNKGINFYVDSRSKDLEIYRGVKFLKLNEKEASAAYKKYKCYSPKGLSMALNIENIIITLGSEGAEMYNNVFNIKCHT